MDGLTRTNKKFPDMEDIRKRMIDDLKSRSKSLKELTHKERFEVLAVLGSAQSQSHSHTPMSEIVIGVTPSYNTGQSKKLEISVRPFNDIPVKSLVFMADSPIMAGYIIEATIQRCDVSKAYEPRVHCYDTGEREFYMDREYKEQENAVKIDILDSSGNVLRSDSC